LKFVLDQDVPDDLSYLLQELGHEVLLLRQVLPTDAADATVLQFARDNGCILITCNRDDFLELASHQGHHGIIVIGGVHVRLNGLLCSACWSGRGRRGLQNNLNFA